MAITTSDKRDPDDFNFEHALESGYAGTPLNAPAGQNIVAGILDSGSIVDLIAAPFNQTLGVTGGMIGEFVLSIGGAGGTVDAAITLPLGIFAAGFGSVDSNGTLNLTEVVGHSNASILVSPQLNCGTGETITAVIGTAFLSFYNTVIRVDTPLKRTIGGTTFQSPEVTLLDKTAPLPVDASWRSIGVLVGGLLPSITAAYYAELDTSTFEFGDPIFPTMLVPIPGFLPLGGAHYYATIGAIEGVPGPTNPLQNMRVLVDTGAQSSIITPGMAANLSLPVEPDFMVEVCGFGGTVEAPGYYIDYIKMNASGGALEFSQAPFVVLDIASPDGGDFAGILGMNFFWNRNVVFEPELVTSSFLHVSQPVPFAYGDFDRDLDVDVDDYEIFNDCIGGAGVIQARPECVHIDHDMDGDIDMADFTQFQQCHSGADIVADPLCGS